MQKNLNFKIKQPIPKNTWKALIVCLLVNLPDNIQTSFSIAEDVSEHKIVGVTEFDEMENEIPFENRDGFWWRKDIQSINFMIHIEIKALSGKKDHI